MTIKSKSFEFWRLLGEVYFSTEGSMEITTDEGVTHLCHFHIHNITKDGNTALSIHLFHFALIVGIIDAKTPPPNDPVGHSSIKRCLMQLYRRTRQAIKPSY